MEQQNFGHAGKVLAEIWSGTVIDGHPVVAKYIEGNTATLHTTQTAEWKSTHVRESQYMVQVVKCSDEACCTKIRSSYFSLIKDKFLPGPLPIEQSLEKGLRVTVGSDRFLPLFVRLALHSDTLPRSAGSYPKGIPYDFACPNMQNKLKQRVCNECGLYHASVKSVISHKKICNPERRVNVTNGNQTFICQPRIRPVRVAAKRHRELMCAIQYMDDIELEWLEKEHVDI